MKRLETRQTVVLRNLSSGLVFAVSLLLYWQTADPDVSYWDCPEYVTCASLLEVGHPPGNPIWMLFMRIATIFFPASSHAYVINICSGIFMALASFFLAQIIFYLVLWTCIKCRQSFSLEHLGEIELAAAVVSAAGGMCFSVCDSAWFSAVEAEVYAMSAFITSLTIWLMLKWAASSDTARRARLLILIAYITGLSLGVHQLNLLCIPVLALIFVFRQYPGSGQTARAVWALLLSFAIVGLVLVGLMHGSLAWAQKLELFAANTLRLPYFAGVCIYLTLAFFSIVAAAIVSGRARRGIAAVAFGVSLWLSGLFVFNGSLVLGAVISAVVAAIVFYGTRMPRLAISSSAWMLGFIPLGYCSFGIILIRGYAAPPMNEGAPGDIFALARYIARDQYGSKPLLYGATPYSRPMLEETWREGDSLPVYSRYILKKGKPLYSAAMPGARLNPRSGMLSDEEKALNNNLAESGTHGYILSDYSFSRLTTPELDMWLPRITGSSPALLDSYESWAGMNRETMTKLEVSATVDSLGNPAGKIGSDGKRHKDTSYRPTYMQNLRILLSYQTYYMYFRYLLWNFAGRQNDIPSTGEIDHGNFITGVPAIDNVMLGNQDLMPENASHGNPGRNEYYCIPFILGIIGIIFLARAGQTGRQTLAIITIFFLMTGIAIVIYLNQSPGEPRERDYSFLGSYMAFCIWIAFGIIGIMKLFDRLVKSWIPKIIIFALIASGVPSLMLAVNFDDHDRRLRNETSYFADNILSASPGIIFTQGDNFTFPLWYATEVLKKGSAARVIDISYLATPEYVVNLMKQGSLGVRFTATPADVAYGAYAFTRIADDADTVPVPLIEALRELYAGRSGAPEMRHSKVWLPGREENDTLFIDLRREFNGSIPFRKLMLLDIIATNLESAEPLPLHFLSQLPADFYSFLRGATRTSAFSEMYLPGISERQYLYSVLSSLGAIRYNSFIQGSLPVYADPVIIDQHRRQRGALIRIGRIMLEHARIGDAITAIVAAQYNHPYELFPAGSFTIADSTYHEGLEHARLLIDLGVITHNTQPLDSAAAHLERMKKPACDWRTFHASLPADRRHTVSDDSRRLILTIPKIDSLLSRIDRLKTEINTDSLEYDPEFFKKLLEFSDFPNPRLESVNR